MRPTLFLTAAALLSAAGRLPAAPDVTDTRLLHMPAVSARHVAFVYADDLPKTRSGKIMRRLLVDIDDGTRSLVSEADQVVS